MCVGGGGGAHAVCGGAHFRFVRGMIQQRLYRKIALAVLEVTKTIAIGQPQNNFLRNLT